MQLKLFVSLILFTCVFAVYLPIRMHKFVTYDDGVYVYDNAHVRSSLNWDSLQWAFTPTEHAN